MRRKGQASQRQCSFRMPGPQPETQTMKTLLPVDGSPYTQKAIDYLNSHPDLLASTCALTILTVLPAISLRIHGTADRAMVTEIYEEDAAKILEPARERLAAHYPNVNALWKVGMPAQVIAAHAEAEGTDLIVMGTHGHGALGNLVMGSVATKVLARCQTPVLLIR